MAARVHLVEQKLKLGTLFVTRCGRFLAGEHVSSETTEITCRRCRALILHQRVLESARKLARDRAARAMGGGR